jgi:TRAP-type C4-dicarboxylate transport system permease small subunit
LNNIRNQVGRLIKAASYLGMAITFVLVWITTVDVVLRKVSNFSILGSYELTEIGMVVLIFLGIAALQVDRCHVRVDLFVNKFAGRAKLITEAVVLLVETVVMSEMTICAFHKIFDNYHKGISTSVLLIPTYPFVAFMCFGLGLFALMLLLDTILAFIDVFKYRNPVSGLKAAD